MDSQSSDKAKTPSGKRKAPEELSTNPHTIKARKRLEKLSADENATKIAKAKQADQGAITYRKRLLVQSQAYLQASLSEQKKMIKDSAQEVANKR